MILSSEGRVVRPAGERRATNMMGAWPMGYGWTDPAAIPPANMWNMQRAGVPVTVETALQVDAVYTALRVISNAIIKMGNPRAYTLGYDSLNRPYRKWLAPGPSILCNTFGDMMQADGMSQTVVSMALFQEAWWHVAARDYLQRPSAIIVLNPVLLEIKRDGSKWYGASGQQVHIPDEDLIHIPFMTLPGAARGLNSIQYNGVAYALALAAMEYGQRWFSQGASPSYILTTDQKLGQAEVQRIAEKFLIDHSGLQASHLPLVVDSGLKVQKTQSTPDEAQYLHTLEYARSIIAAWFGLPSHLMGGNSDKGNVWGRTVQEQGFQMVDYTLSGYVVRLEEAFSSMLARGTFAKLDESAIIRANAADDAKRILAERTAGTMTLNDVHAERMEPPVDSPIGDDPLVPLNTNTSIPTGEVFADEAAQEDPKITAPEPTRVELNDGNDQL